MMGSGTGVCRRLRRLHVLVVMGLIGFVLLVFHEMRDMDAADAASSSSHHLNAPVNHAERQLQHNYNYNNGGGGGDAAHRRPPPHGAAVPQPPPAHSATELVYYRRDLPLFWIGGVPRSGTTLMRAMLDAHGQVRCGEETRVIPRILGMHTGMEKSLVEMARLKEAKIDSTVLDSALGAYILSIIAQHGEPAPFLCNKDPFTLRSMSRLLNIFPQSKFILMVRDGRATAHSIISRHVTIKGFDIRTYRGAMKDWNRAITSMYGECTKHEAVCLPVHYEQLVLHPEAQMRRILHFLGVAWDEQVMHHEQTIGKDKGVSLSKKELSTDQVDKPVNTGALISWVEYIPSDVRDDMDVIAPMLKTLGYDPHAYPPNYGTPDRQVAEDSANLKDKVAPPQIKVAELGDKKAPVVL